MRGRYVLLTLAFILALLILPSTLALSESEKIYRSQALEIDFNISASIEVSSLSSEYSMDSLLAELFYFPRNDDLQSVISLSTEPNAEISEESIIFRWDNLLPGPYLYSIDSKVMVENRMAYFSDKIIFPLENLPDDIKQFSKPYGNIDSYNPSIIKKANELVSGEDDLFLAVYNLASWTNNNIDYNLSTLTADASQKASWVLENKYGVCDELTNLFIAMCRAVGIPARFVSGISYTNSDLFAERWGPHGWAEVYFPDKGWIPFDVTYGEFGYVDASHIRLMSSTSSRESSVSYEWYSSEADVQTHPLVFSTSVDKFHGNIEEMFSFTASVLRETVGFGSYNLVEVDVHNPSDFYIPAELFVSKTQGAEILGDYSKELLMLPRSSDKIFWIVKIGEDLDEKYRYTFPLEIYTRANSTQLIEFTAKDGAAVYTHSEMEKHIEQSEFVRVKELSHNVDANCSVKKYFYLDNDSFVKCTIINMGNMAENFEICLDLSCKNINLGISQSAEVNLPFEANKSGIYEKDIFIHNKFLSASSNVNITVYDRPLVSIMNLSYPSQISYGKNTSINFTLEKVSFSNPSDIEVILRTGSTEKIWHKAEMNNDLNYIVYIDTSDLSKENFFELFISYKDHDGNHYTTEGNFSIMLENLNTKEKTLVFAKDMLRVLESSMLLSVLIISFFVFVIVMAIILGGTRKEDYGLKKYKNKLDSETTEEIMKEIEKEEGEDEKMFSGKIR